LPRSAWFDVERLHSFVFDPLLYCIGPTLVNTRRSVPKYFYKRN
jgi:hypothetical protein